MRPIYTIKKLGGLSAEQLEKLLLKRKEMISYYSPYNFDRKIDPQKLWEQQADHYREQFREGKYAAFTVNASLCAIFYESLSWDRHFFGFETIRLHQIFTMDHSLGRMKNCLEYFLAYILPEGAYCFTEIPSEDTVMLQALTSLAFNLIETRLCYFNNELSQGSNQQRFPVRAATAADISNLKRVAQKMANPYDRFHADPHFGPEKAGAFIAAYIEESVKGFADYVMVPDQSGLPPDAFLTAKYLNAAWDKLDYKISKMVLSAVAADTNRGWYYKLITEMTRHLQETAGCSCIFMNTQSTNRAVLRTWEKAGYQIGNTTHLLSITK